MSFFIKVGDAAVDEPRDKGHVVKSEYLHKVINDDDYTISTNMI